MKVLVTGLQDRLDAGWSDNFWTETLEIRGTILPNDPCRERLKGLDIELVEGDLKNLDYITTATKGVNAVIHTANIVGPRFENNVQTNLQVTRACSAYAEGLERYIYISSSGVFPNNGETIACAYPSSRRTPSQATRWRILPLQTHWRRSCPNGFSWNGFANFYRPTKPCPIRHQNIWSIHGKPSMQYPKEKPEQTRHWTLYGRWDWTLAPDRRCS